MALADYIYRLKPESGDSTPHDEKGVSSDLSGGTIALADAGGGDYYWQFTGVASASGFSAAVDTNSDSTGITMAARFSVPTYDTVDGFAYLLQALTASPAYGPSLGQSSANFIRPRVVDSGNLTATAVNIGTAVRTVVVRFKPTVGADVLDVWWNGMGTGDTPDYTTTGNMNTRTYTRLLAGSANSVFRLFDCVIWGEALSDADCAALADNGIRTTLDTGSPSDLSGTATLAGITASGSMAPQPDSSLSGTAALGGITASGDLGVAPGVITTPVLKNNTGTVLASVSNVVANVYNATTGALVVRKTGLSSDGSGVVVITDAALMPGTAYAYEIDLSAASLGRRLPLGTAA
ncbi:MAG: hypothetical protein KDH18_25840 [Rhodoferax sp.]|nr:hypothetical protein [Rhodoferax sp.]